MAKEDLDAMVVVRTEAPKTAGDGLVGFGESVNDVENWEAARAAGVASPGLLNYEAALGKYEDREDIETLAEKNARNAPDEFADQAFMRASVNGPSGSGSGN